MKAETKLNMFVQGYACALATLIRLEGCSNAHSDELLKSIGGIERLHKADIDSYDMDVIDVAYPTLPPAAPSCCDTTNSQPPENKEGIL
jgi:hypothetical protein